jgi:hypothetical protein
VRGTSADLFLVEGDAERVVRPQLGGCDDGVAAVSGDAHALALGTKDEFGMPEVF